MDRLVELTAQFAAVWPLLDERTRRLLAASEALSLGYGGVSLAHRACGLSRKTILSGVREIEARATAPSGRIRRAGAGRKAVTVPDPSLVESFGGLD